MNKAITDASAALQGYAAGVITEPEARAANDKMMRAMAEYASTRAGADHLLQTHAQHSEAGNTDQAARVAQALDEGARIAAANRIAENQWRADNNMAPLTTPLPQTFAQITAAADAERQAAEENTRRNMDPLGLRTPGTPAHAFATATARPHTTVRANTVAEPAHGAPRISPERRLAQQTASMVLAGQAARIEGTRTVLPETGGIVARYKSNRQIKQIAKADPTAPEPYMVQRYKGWLSSNQVLAVSQQLRENATPYFNQHPIGERDSTGRPKRVSPQRLVDAYVRANLDSELTYHASSH